MSIIHSHVNKIKSINNIEHLQAVFLYPKLVIFENNVYFRIVSLEPKNEDESNNTDKDFNLDHEIMDKTMLDNYLWLILKSGELMVIDILNGAHVKIVSDNYANYRFQQLKMVSNKLYLISESGECLDIPLTTKELTRKLREGSKEISVHLEKAHVRRSEVTSIIKKNYTNGLYFYIDAGNIIMECPMTGVSETISTNARIEHSVPWSDIVVVTDKLNMWMIDVVDSKIVFESKLKAYYYLLAGHNKGFYYLTWNETEINICCAWNATSPSRDQHHTDRSTAKLSSQEVLKSQMENVIDAALAGAEPFQVLPQLKTLIEKIEDIKFIVTSITKLCQNNSVYKAILYTLQKKVFANGEKELIDLIKDLMIKIELLEYIQFRDNQSYKNVNLFQLTLKQLCVTFISNSDLDLASICWLKYSEIKLNMTPDDVLDILNVIPHNTKMGALIIWMRNFVPSLLDEDPYFIDLFVKWTTHRVFLLEQSAYWPKIGLKFIDDITAVLETSLNSIALRPISVDDLDILKDHINYIIELKEKYKINMLLGEISSQSPNEVALIMLRRCYSEDLGAFLQDFLPSFVTRYQFELDDTLRSYIENEAATCGGGIDSARLKVLLHTFRSPTNKLDCLLQVLKVLDVPWDDTVLELSVAAAASVYKDFTVTDADLLLAQEIQKELNYAKVKVVLKKYNFPLSCTDYKLVLHKLVSAATVDVNDLKIITSVINAYWNYGNILYIDRCLRDCDTKAALDYFNNLNLKQKRILLKAVISKYEQIINGNQNAIIERNFLDFLKGTQMLDNIEVKDIENLYHLKNSYNIAMDINSLYSENNCTDKANNWMNKDGVTASSGRGRCVTQLTRTYQSQHSALVALLRRASTTNRVRQLVECLINAYVDEINDGDLDTVLSHFKNGQNSTLLVDSYNVLIELVTNCGEEHLHHLIKCLSVMNALMNANIVVTNLSIAWKFHYIFLPMSSVTATNNLIEFYGNTSYQDNLDTTLRSIANKSDFMVFRIFSDMHSSSNCLKRLDHYFDIKENAVKRLLSKIITSQDLDEVLLTNLLMMSIPQEDSDHKMWIIDLLQGQNETLPTSLLCYLSSPPIRRTFSLDDILPGKTISYPPHYILKSKFNINLGDIAVPDSTEETWDAKVVLFHVLRQYPDTTFDRLVELCRTLNVPINYGLALQLVSLLMTWELKYKIYNDELGCRKLYVENNGKDLISACCTIWDSIEDTDFLRDILIDFWKTGEVTLHSRLISINPYYYEVFIAIFYLIYGSSAESRNKKEYYLLNFLKDYTRRSAPKQYEFELFSVKGLFPEIGYYRLPFHLFMREDMWSNLKSEITLETYERWLPAVALLSLDADLQTARDMICSNALKQTMTSRKRDDLCDENLKENEPWRLTTREEPLLRAAHRCVRHIANMEWAGACLFYVLQGCARGADQVAAAHLCYQFAQRWAALQPGNRAVRQMERLHSTLSTRHALHKIEWACEEFLRLTTEPAQLIRALYLHPSFVQKMSRHDVNRATNEIADKNGISISSIRMQILENILSRSNEDNKNEKFCGLDTKQLMTAKYILKATCPKMGAIYLSRIAFDDESDFNKSKKLRALQCLMSVVDTDTAIKVTSREREALWQSLLELLFTVNLENIDMPWVVATFMQDKVRALDQLLHAAGGNIASLKIAADLAYRFGNEQSIRDLIPHLLRAELREEVAPLLVKVSSPPDDLIYTAWRAFLLSPFQRADYPITERQKSKCLNAINFLPICPFIKDADLIEIWNNCIRCKCFGLGCLVLPYINPQVRQTIPELQKIDRRHLIASLKNLQSETYLVSGAMHVIESMASKVYR